MHLLRGTLEELHRPSPYKGEGRTAVPERVRRVYRDTPGAPTTYRRCFSACCMRIRPDPAHPGSSPAGRATDVRVMTSRTASGGMYGFFDTISAASAVTIGAANDVPLATA